MRTQSTLDRIVTELQANCGDLLDACRKTGVSLIFVNQWCKDDPKVQEKITEAERVGVQGLVSEAIRRGARGVTEDIYFKGAVVGHKQVYSDGLLTTLLKAKLPEFSTSEGGATNVTVNVANVMPRADNYEAWLAMKKATIATPPTKQLEHTKNIQDVEYTEISDAGQAAYALMRKPLEGISL